MSLTIFQVAYPFAPVGPDAVGGADQVLNLIERNLPRFGHRAIGAACTGSRTESLLLATPRPAATITNAVRAATEAAHARTIQAALDRHAVDLVPMHGIDFQRYLPPPDVPVLVTLHLPPGWYPPEVLRLERPETWLHAVSWSQHRACPGCATLLPPVGNGVPVGVLASPSVQAAHREALPGLLRAGLLRLHALRLDDETVAVIYGLADPPGRDNHRVYFYLSGFDPRLERVSPGMLLVVGQAVEAATTEGMAHADFLRGRESYKYFGGAEDCPTFHRRLLKRGSG